MRVVSVFLILLFVPWWSLDGQGAEPFRQEYSLVAAAKYLDRATIEWQEEKRCFACHTDYPYLIARAAVSRDLATHDRIRSTLEQRVEEPWVRKSGPYRNSEFVMVAAVLAHNDAVTTGKLHPLTRRALDRIWTVQSADGGWIWQKGNKPPSGIDDHYGATMATIAAGVAPDGYAKTPAARAGLDKVRAYFRDNPPLTMHNRAMMLWAASYVDGIVTDDDCERAINDLFALQKPDGGWGVATLGDWNRCDGKEQDKESSDGYGTGLVVYVLRRAEVAAGDPRIQNGIKWLKEHQRANGSWFTRSPYRDGRHLITNTGTAYALLALTSCGETVEDASDP